MPPFTVRLSRGWSAALDHLPLALVPLVTALLATEKIRRVVGFHGRHVGLRLGLPVGVVDLWQFVSLPGNAAGVGFPLPSARPLALVVVPLAVLVQAALAAGYFGSLEGALTAGEFDFPENVRQHFVPFLGYTLIPLVVVLPIAVVGLGGPRSVPPLVIVLVPAFVVAAYLFYATPYLVVLRDLGLVDAARRSYQLATAGGPYLRYAAGYAGFVLALSLVTTAVVVNLGLVGVAVGIVALAPVGLAANAATLRFVADVDDGSPSLGGWDGEPGAEEPVPDGPDPTAEP